jgi:hypothetical protein
MCYLDETILIEDGAEKKIVLPPGDEKRKSAAS